jgi:hypothetical protein
MENPCAGWCRLARHPVATSPRRAWRRWAASLDLDEVEEFVDVLENSGA